MRARVLRFNPREPDAFEASLNNFLEDAGPTRIESVTLMPPINELIGGEATAVIFYSARTESRPAQLCTQCRKKPPFEDLKICEACRDYQADYRKKRKADSKVRYP
jgi:hypothetical protein